MSVFPELRRRLATYRIELREHPIRAGVVHPEDIHEPGVEEEARNPHLWKSEVFSPQTREGNVWVIESPIKIGEGMDPATAYEQMAVTFSDLLNLLSDQIGGSREAEAQARESLSSGKPFVTKGTDGSVIFIQPPIVAAALSSRKPVLVFPEGPYKPALFEEGANRLQSVDRESGRARTAADLFFVVPPAFAGARLIRSRRGHQPVSLPSPRKARRSPPRTPVISRRELIRIGLQSAGLAAFGGVLRAGAEAIPSSDSLVTHALEADGEIRGMRSVLPGVVSFFHEDNPMIGFRNAVVAAKLRALEPHLKELFPLTPTVSLSYGTNHTGLPDYLRDSRLGESWLGKDNVEKYAYPSAISELHVLVPDKKGQYEPRCLDLGWKPLG